MPDAPDPSAASPFAVAPGEPAAPSRRRRRRWPWVLGVLVLLFLCWSALVGMRVLSAYQHARDGLDQMRDVRSSATEDLHTFVDSIGGDTDDTPEEAIPGQLSAAADDFSQAHEEIDSPLLAPLQLVPVVGRQVRSVSALTGAAATTASEAGTAFAALSEEAARKPTTPEERLAGATHAQEVLTDLQTGLSDLDLGPDEGLVGPPAEARDRFVEEYDHTMDTLDRAVTSITGIDAFLTGPSRYLVLAANNAEMRAGSGMYLQVGELTVEDGTFTLSDFIPAQDLLLAEPGATVDPDIQRNWGWLAPDQEWRNLNLSPRFDESARMATEMWAASGRGQVDGVIAIDVIGLERLLALTGPVDVPTADGGVTTLSAENVRQDLLLDQYRDFGDDREARRDRLGDVGKAAFESFNTRPFSAYRLMQTLQESGDGRNLMVWSSDPVEQAAWVAIGASGIPPSDALLLAVLNRGGNKLDQFLGVTASLTSVTTGDMRRVTVTVDLANDTPTGLPTYVAGPHPLLPTGGGEYVGIVSLTVPKGAGNPAITGGEPFLVGEDGPTRVLTSMVDLNRGDRTTVTFAFDLPTSWTEVEVLPSARSPEVTWTAGSQTWTDTAPQTVELSTLG